MPSETPGAGPVLTKDAIEKAVVGLASAVAILTAQYGWWSPTGEQVLAIGGVAGSVYVFVAMIASFATRQKVTPEATVQKRIEAAVIRRVADLDAQRARHGAKKAARATVPTKAVKKAQRRQAA